MLFFGHEEVGKFLVWCISRINDTEPVSIYQISEKLLRAGTEIQESPRVVL